MSREWPVWRLVTEKVATLEEIDTTWCYSDILKGNAVLDMINDIKAEYNKEVSKRGRR